MVAADRIYLREAPAKLLPAPVASTGVIGWLRANLFSSRGNIALTIICVALIVWIVPPLLRFFFFDAVWSGADREACLPSVQNPEPGACWAFIRAWSSYFTYGFYPLGERWRADHRSTRRADLAVGRHSRHHRRGDSGDRGLAAARYFVSARATLRNAGGA